MRERLIDLLDNYGDDISLCDVCKRPSEDCEGCKNEQLAEFLLANGVIVPKCKIGDTIYRIGDNGRIYADWEILCIQVYEEEILYIDDSNNYFNEDDIGKTVFLSREEAEKALEGGAK